MTIFFSNEKLFAVDFVSNSRTNRFNSHQPVQKDLEHVKYTFKTKHPTSVMHLKKPPSSSYLIKVDTNEYIRTVENHVKPWIDAHYFPDNNVVFFQDRASPHLSQKIQRWPQENMPKHRSKEL